MNEDLVERVAEAIYHVDGGMSDEDYLAATGQRRKLWKTDAPWDPDELEEHERDEYRMMAMAAIRAILGE